MGFNQVLGEKARWELYKNAEFLEQILEAAP